MGCQRSPVAPVHHEAGAVPQPAADRIQHVKPISLLGIEPVHRGRSTEADGNGFAAAEIQPVESDGAIRIRFAVDPGPNLHDLSAAQIPLDRTSTDERVNLRRSRHSTLTAEEADNFGNHRRRMNLARGQR